MSEVLASRQTTPFWKENHVTLNSISSATTTVLVENNDIVLDIRGITCQINRRRVLVAFGVGFGFDSATIVSLAFDFLKNCSWEVYSWHVTQILWLGGALDDIELLEGLCE